MTIPFKRWNNFNLATLEALYSGAPDSESEWLTNHYGYCKGGLGVEAGGTRYYRMILIPSESDFELPTSLDSPMKGSLRMDFSIDTDTSSPSMVDCDLIHGILDDLTSPKEWDPDRVTGRHYDGVNTWENWPQSYQSNGSNYQQLDTADLPKSYEAILKAYGAAHGSYVYHYRAELFRLGILLLLGNYNPTDPNAVGEEYYLSCIPRMLEIRYFNTIVNSLSRYYMKTGGGEQVVITGLGFNNSDSEIDEGGPTKPGGWSDLVDFIYLVGLQGQGTTTLSRTATDFSVDSNSQITISSMPAMSAGTYEIKVRKDQLSTSIDSYAGDYSCESDGTIHSGKRMTFLVSDTVQPTTSQWGPAGDFRKRSGPIILSKWGWKDQSGATVDDHYSFTDIRATDKFYRGLIERVTGIRRAINDKTGLFQVSDMSLDLINTGMYFSKKLASYPILKNQVVETYLAWKDEPEAWKSDVLRGIVDEYSLKGDTFSVMLKDYSQKYFRVKVPRQRCTSSEYTNIDDSAKGKAMPDCLGLNSKTAGDNLGAVEARYIDTVNFKYLAAGGSLKEITEVYSANSLVGGANYSISYEDGGRTYITFTGDQGTNKVTFNCKGYMYEEWNHADGYIRNPAYIIAFLIGMIAEMPISLFDVISFDDLASLFTDLGWDDAGRIILQDERDADAVLAELLFTPGAVLFPDKLGRFKAMKKDISNFQTSIYIFSQLGDCLESPRREFNTRQAVNKIKGLYDYYPTHSEYKSDLEDSHSKSIEDFEVEMEPPQAYNFPWTDSQDMVTKRLEEELDKLAYGDQKLSLSLPICFQDEIDLYDNFQLQDLFGISATGGGESGRYYCIESMDVDAQEEKIDITAMDLQWLLRQWFVLGDEDAIPSNWSSATYSDMMFGYLCDEDTDEFADGKPGKKLIDENLLVGY